MCVTGCPYKKVYFNWSSGKSEKCIFCYPRIESGQPTVCSETCAGRIRYLGVVLYDADRIATAAATPRETDLYQAQLDVFLDPADPQVIEQARRKRQLFWGSNLFHVGILFLLLGHTVGLLTPKAIYTLFVTVEQKQRIAIIAGGLAGIVCFVGLSLLLHRRLFDARIRQTSTYMDLAVLMILWVQLALGLLTLPLSLGHADGEVMLRLSAWAQGILTVQPVDARTLQGIDWPYLVHLVLGMTIFLIFPFSRLVHIWSAPVWYLGRRGYQVVRSRRPLAPGE